MSTITEVIENWETLDLEDKEFSFEIMKKGLIESQRDSLVERIKEAKQNYYEGKVRTGSAKDLFREVNSV
ncbi:MAG: hypothetical protein RO257_10230 [Candidatus Kapabacteria bacterium]|nr:hypothetical protein [Candidatus Kapabacteria bacterium]